MRVLIVLVGMALVMAGLAVAAHQGALWLRYGDWTPIQFSTLWFTLGGAEPTQLALRPAGAVLAWLLNQPLSVVLLIGGACIAWLGIERAKRPGGRF